MEFSFLQLAAIAVALFVLGSFLSIESGVRDRLIKQAVIALTIVVLVILTIWTFISAARWAWDHPLF